MDRNDIEYAKKVVARDSIALLFHKEWQDNDEIVEAAVRYAGTALRFASKKLQDNDRIVKLALQNAGSALAFASKRLRDREDIVLMAIIKTRGAIIHASEKQQKNPKILFYYKDDYSDVSDEELIRKNQEAFPNLKLNKGSSIKLFNDNFKMIDFSNPNLDHLSEFSFNQYDKDRKKCFETYCKNNFMVIEKLLKNFYKSYKEQIVTQDNTKNDIYDFMKMVITSKEVLSTFYSDSKFSFSDMEGLSNVYLFYDDSVGKEFLEYSKELIEKYRDDNLMIYNEIVGSKFGDDPLDKVLLKYKLNENNIYDFINNNKYYEDEMKEALLNIVNGYYGTKIKDDNARSSKK